MYPTGTGERCEFPPEAQTSLAPASACWPASMEPQASSAVGGVKQSTPAPPDPDPDRTLKAFQMAASCRRVKFTYRYHLLSGPTKCYSEVSLSLLWTDKGFEPGTFRITFEALRCMVRNLFCIKWSSEKTQNSLTGRPQCSRRRG